MADVFAAETGAVSFYEVPFGEQSKVAVNVGDDAGDGGLSGSIL